MEQSDTLGVLRQLERGEITSEEADARLNAPTVERVDEPPFEFEGAPRWARAFWLYPLVSGLAGVGIGAWIIVATRANPLWFVCGLPILLLGALITAISASATNAHWLYVNVDESRKGKKRVRFAMPFPLGLVRLALWFAKLFGRHPKAKMMFRSQRHEIPLDWADADAFLDALERELREHRGVTVDVDDKGERVQVYIV
ncbi:MAG: hypothetical protein HY868_19070 [Chloroflexi bacterium]|nr:hypothetical protein [Chloroflexota bacterium]